MKEYIKAVSGRLATGQALTADDMLYYRRVCAVLAQTHDLMQNA